MGGGGGGGGWGGGGGGGGGFFFFSGGGGGGQSTGRSVTASQKWRVRIHARGNALWRVSTGSTSIDAQAILGLVAAPHPDPACGQRVFEDDSVQCLVACEGYR